MFKKLLEAVLENNLPKVQNLITTTHSLLNQEDNLGQTALLWASSRGHTGIVKYLVLMGADLNAATQDRKGECHNWTPLHWACKINHMDVMRILIEAGAIDSPVGNGEYVIHKVVKKNNFEVVNLLLHKYPNLLDQKDGLGQTPLLWAASLGLTQMVTYLISKGADLNAATNNPSKSEHNRTALHWAIEKKHWQSAKLLILAGAPIDKEMLKNQGFVSVIYQNADLLSVFLNNVSLLRASCGGVMGFIHKAASEGYLDVVKAVCEKYPAFLNQQDSNGQTPLLWAASRGHADVVMYLISKNADLNVATNTRDENEHKTALHWAIDKKHWSTVKILIKAGATIDARMLKSKEFLDYIFQNLDIVAILLNNRELLTVNIDGGGLIHVAAQKGHLNVLKAIFERYPGALCDQMDSLGQTPLIWASSEGHLDVVEYLTSIGANLNATTNKPKSENHNNTALLYALKKGHWSIAKVLIQAGAIDDVLSESVEGERVHNTEQFFPAIRSSISDITRLSSDMFIHTFYDLLKYLKENKSQRIEAALPLLDFYINNETRACVGRFIWKISELYNGEVFPQAQVSLMVNGKAALLHYFASLTNTRVKQQFLNEACDPSTPLGQIFQAGSTNRRVSGITIDQLIRHAWEHNSIKPVIGQCCGLSKEMLLGHFDKLNRDEALSFLYEAHDPLTAIGRVFATKRGMYGAWVSSLTQLTRKAAERDIFLTENRSAPSAPPMAQAQLISEFSMWTSAPSTVDDAPMAELHTQSVGDKKL